jgi:ABC-type nitrate/sulfonate/bicarbonate transport system substrate-binding protein
MALAEPASGGALQHARVASGLLTTWQSIAWLGAEAGLFKKLDIIMSFPALSVGGPEAVAGLVRGNWEFAHTGLLPVAEQVLAGQDVVIVATPTCQFASTFVMTRPGIDDLAKLDGKKVGLVTETGQTSVAARLAIEKAGANATYVTLQTFDNVYAAFAAGEVDAGALPVDLRLKGREQHGWNLFALNEFDTPSVFATTRRLIASNRDFALRVMQGFVETIQVFKTRPDIIVPLLQRYLKIEDRDTVEQLHAFHVPLFQTVPRPLPIGLPVLREYLLKTFPNAAALRECDICDASLINELDDCGFMERMCANAPNFDKR